MHELRLITHMQSREEETYGEVPAVPGVGGGHHVLGVKHLHRELRLRDGGDVVECATTSSQRGIADHEEVQGKGTAHQ